MELLAKEGYEFVAVFDADFKPEPGFLQKTVPYLMGNPDVSRSGSGVAVGWVRAATGWLGAAAAVEVMPVCRPTYPYSRPPTRFTIHPIHSPPAC